MIKKIRMKFGAGVDQPPLTIDVTPVTVFVGPNNSGKSRVLVEIENYCRKMHGQKHDLIIENVEFIPYEKDEIESELSKLEQAPNEGENVNPGNMIIGKLNAQNNQIFREQLPKQPIIDGALNPNAQAGWFGRYLSIYTVRMDGTNRLNLLGSQPAGDLKTAAMNHLAHLFVDNSLREEVRRIVYDAFSKYFVIDPTNIGNLQVRLSDRRPKDEREEKGWETDSIEFHKKASPISSASDGVRAFSGIIATILAGDPKVALIDEPEAFLHPALASKLGKEVASALRASKKRLFVSTHSSMFLMGCIQAGLSLNIVRLTYNNNVPTARILPQEKILPLMRNPLLRSTGVLNGLFYESVIVTEADSDRAFYQEVNERLLTAGDPRGIPSCLFINAQNKQTVWDIVRPLRELGIPALGIVDIDVLKDGGQVWTKPLSGAFVPQISHEALHIQRQSILRALELTGKDFKRDGGISLLSGQDREACENLLASLKDYGILVVSGGELESWLPSLNIPRNKSKWLIETFERMGDSPDQEHYVHPSSGDVWDFIGSAKSWLVDSSRKGIPV